VAKADDSSSQNATSFPESATSLKDVVIHHVVHALPVSHLPSRVAYEPTHPAFEIGAMRSPGVVVWASKPGETSLALMLQFILSE